MDHFGIFAKYWQPGKVKTRLGASIGDTQSAAFYQAMLRFLVDSLKTVGQQRTLVFTPHDTREQFENLNATVDDQWTLAAQSSGPLGKRMTHFFETAFTPSNDTEQTDNVVLIGSDCPQITPAVCQSAFDSLKDNDVVLGPTLDGGYYLVGMSQKFHDVFSGITYSTESVLKQTLNRMDSNGLSYALLDPLQDIDELPQLIDLHKSLTANADTQPQHRSLLSAIKSALPEEFTEPTE